MGAAASSHFGEGTQKGPENYAMPVSREQVLQSEGWGIWGEAGWTYGRDGGLGSSCSAEGEVQFINVCVCVFIL